MRAQGASGFLVIFAVVVIALIAVSGGVFFSNETNTDEVKIDEVNIDIEKFDLPPQWIIIEELDKNIEKQIEIIYEDGEPKKLRLIGFTHPKPCQPGEIKDNAYWLQIWFVLDNGETIMENKEYQLGDNYLEVLVFDIDGNKMVDNGSKIVGIIVVDVAKNFEQTRVMLNK